ncbi:MAG: hypothetical protein AB7V36_06320 [Bacteroidales bacterium]
MKNTKEKTTIEKIREILLREWDPIGIGTNIKIRDEYDGYIGGILNLLVKKESTVFDFISYLRKVEFDLTGNVVDEHNLNKAASILFDLKEDNDCTN